MARIKVDGVRQYDGEYELAEDRGLNAREWRWIKKVSGYMPLTISEGFEGDDPDLYVALAVVAMCREGKIASDDWQAAADELSEAPYGSIVAVYETSEDDVPLALTSEPNEPSPTGSLENNNSPGEASPTSSETSEPTQSPTTESNSVTSSTSNLKALAS